MAATLTPLGGPFPAPASYLLTIDGSRILLDAGCWDASPDFPLSSTLADQPAQEAKEAARAQTLAYLATLKELAPSLNLVLLTHPLLSSVGLLPWLKARCGLRCPVYATLPTREMGRWAVEEWVQGRSAEEKNDALAAVASTAVGPLEKKGKGKGKQQRASAPQALEDADEEEQDPWRPVWNVSTTEIRDAFLSVSAVRWTQPVHLSGSYSVRSPCQFQELTPQRAVGLLKGYTLVAHRAGHTLGGCLYTIRPSLSSSLSPASSSSSLLYAPIFNHVKEHHLDGAALLNGAKVDDLMRRMGVVVIGASRSQIINVKRVDRERALLGTFLSLSRRVHARGSFGAFSCQVGWGAS